MLSKIIYVRWLDSASTPEWSSPPSEHSGLAEVETVGYLILEDDNHIQVAQSKFEDLKLGAILAIPKPVILERRVLRMLKSKKIKS